MEQATDFSDRLRPIFDLCDAEKKGYITVDHFTELAKENFAADEGQEKIKEVANLLDITGNGRISFSEFCIGVKKILELTGPPSPAVDNVPTGKLISIGSQDTLVPVEDDGTSSGTYETSEHSTFNEYDIMTDDDAGISSPSSIRDHVTSPQLLSDEEWANAMLNGHKQNLELLDSFAVDQIVYSSSPVKQRRAYFRSSKAISSAQLASHLYNSGGIGPHRQKSHSNDVFTEIDGSFVALNDKVKTLESQLLTLTDNQVKADDRHNKLKEENAILVERIHLLEEQLREVEIQSQDQIEEERNKYREAMARSDRGDYELLSESLHCMKGEYEALKEEAPRLRTDGERLRKENQRLEEQLKEQQNQMLTLSQENEVLKETLQSERADVEREREVHAQLLDEVTRELDELRTYKLMVEAGQSPSKSQQNDEASLQETKAHLLQVKQENHQLREQNEDLQAALLSRHLREGQALLNNGPGITLAEEMEALPKDQLMQTLREQQDANYKLREYMDNLMLRIIEHHPALLEITDEKPK